MNEIEIGAVGHFFDKIGVALVNLTLGDLAVGDTVHIKGNTSDVTCKVDSMRLEKDNIERATKGQSVGIKIAGRVREHDKVFKVVP